MPPRERPKMPLSVHSANDPIHTPPSTPQQLPEPISRSSDNGSSWALGTPPMPPPTNIPWCKPMDSGTKQNDGGYWDSAPALAGFTLPAAATDLIMPAAAAVAAAVSDAAAADCAADAPLSPAQATVTSAPTADVGAADVDQSCAPVADLAVHAGPAAPVDDDTQIFGILNTMNIPFIPFDENLKQYRGPRLNWHCTPFVAHVQMFPARYKDERLEMLQMLCNIVAEGRFPVQVAKIVPIRQQSDGKESLFSFHAVVLTTEPDALLFAIHKRVLFDSTGLWWAASNRAHRRLCEYCDRLRKQSTDIRHQVTHEMPCKALVFEPTLNERTRFTILEQFQLEAFNMFAQPPPPPPPRFSHNDW